MTVLEAVSITENLDAQINVYPVPATTNMTVTLNGNGMIETLQLFTDHGAMVYFVNNIQDNRFEIDVTEFSTGTYFLRVKTSQGVTTKRVIIHKR